MKHLIEIEAEQFTESNLGNFLRLAKKALLPDISLKFEDEIKGRIGTNGSYGSYLNEEDWLIVFPDHSYIILSDDRFIEVRK